MNDSATKRIAKNFSWLFVGNAISGGTNFVLIIYVARMLGAATFGLWQFSQAFLLYFILLVDYGISILGTREIAKEKNKAGLISINMFAARLLVAIIVFALSLAILYFLPISLNVKLLFVFTFLFLFYRALNADWVFQGLEKMEFISLAKVLFAVFSFLLIVLMVKGPNDLLKVPLLQSLVGLAVSVAILLVLYRKFLPMDLKSISLHQSRIYFFQAIPLCGSVFMMQINNSLDRIMLGFMKGPIIVGYYSAAYRIFYIFAAILSIWTATALPVVSKRILDDKEKTKVFLDNFLRLTILIVLPMSIFGFFASPIIINLFFGAQYSTAVLAFMVLIWALIPFAMANIYAGLILIAVGAYKQFFLSVLAGAGINVFLNFILIPPFSYVGAAVATIAAQIFVALVAFFLSRKILRISSIEYLIKPLIASMVAVIFAVIAYFSLFSASMFMRQLIGCSIFALTYLFVAFILERDFLFMFINEIMGIKKNVKSS